jgi:hypothetical protein
MLNYEEFFDTSAILYPNLSAVLCGLPLSKLSVAVACCVSVIIPFRINEIPCRVFKGTTYNPEWGVRRSDQVAVAFTLTGVRS